jgi:hypothetical protein
MALFLTGATVYLGSYLVAGLLTEYRDSTVAVAGGGKAKVSIQKSRPPTAFIICPRGLVRRPTTN